MRAASHLQGVRCTNATWPFENSTTGRVCTRSELLYTRMLRGSSAERGRGVLCGCVAVGSWGVWHCAMLVNTFLA
jgi:hypothetical protein